MSMMSLGMFVFSLPTLAYQDLQRRSGWRHARSERIGAKDAVQFVGPENDTFSLRGNAPAELMKGHVSLDKLRDMAKDGEAWPLVDGSGVVYGSYVITGIDEGQSYFLPNGTARMIDFSMELLEVDAPASASRAGE